MNLFLLVLKNGQNLVGVEKNKGKLLRMAVFGKWGLEKSGLTES